MTGCCCGYLPKLIINVAPASGNPSRCLVVSSLIESPWNLRLRSKFGDSCASALCGDDDGFHPFLQRPASSSSSCSVASAMAVFCLSGPNRHGTIELDSDSDSDSDREPDLDRKTASDATLQADALSKVASSPFIPGSSEKLEPESWLLINGEDVPTVVSSLPLRKRYAPGRLLELLAKKLDTGKITPEQLKNSLMFWKKKKEDLQEGTSFGTSAFGEQGVSTIHQWTATELTLQHARLVRIARDILYLILACSLLGIVRVAEAVAVTFSTRPPHYSRLLDAANSLDFFTMAFLANSVRKPVIGILCVDPINLDEVVQLKSKIWDEMHKFYERQWKLVATLAVGRLLALIAKKLPSTNVLTKHIKMGWDFLLALPIF